MPIIIGKGEEDASKLQILAGVSDPKYIELTTPRFTSTSGQAEQNHLYNSTRNLSKWALPENSLLREKVL